MCSLHQLINKQVEIKVSGTPNLTGTLIDLGTDLLVLNHRQRFFYIPFIHVKSIKSIRSQSVDEGNAITCGTTESLSLQSILEHAKGLFVEIYVSGNRSIHGCLTDIMNDYVVFYSPAYKRVYICLNHLKWLVPYAPDLAPYSLGSRPLPVNPVSPPIPRTFEELCNQLAGNVVLVDFGDHPNKIGLLQKTDNQVMELVNANGETVFWGTTHLKTLYMP